MGLRIRPEWLPKGYFLEEVDADHILRIYRDGLSPEPVGDLQQLTATPRRIRKAIEVYELELSLV